MMGGVVNRSASVGLVGGARSRRRGTGVRAGAVGKLHHRQVAGHLERELVARPAVGLRRGAVAAHPRHAMPSISSALA